MKNPVILGLFLVAIGVATALADEGRVPIFQVTSISQPGTYVLTRNIGAMVGSAITIQASNVTLDLNGMTVTTSDTFAPIIQIGDNFEGIHIRDGRLGGGSYGIFYGTGGGVSPSTIWIENVVISQTLPAECTFVSATSTQGGLTKPAVGTTGSVVCSLLGMAGNSKVTVTVVVIVRDFTVTVFVLPRPQPAVVSASAARPSPAAARRPAIPAPRRSEGVPARASLDRARSRSRPRASGRRR